MTESLRLFIYDGSGNLIRDPWGEIAEFDPPTFRTAWPGGFLDLNTRIKRPISRPWNVKQTYRAVLRHGLKTVFEGRIEDLPETMTRASEKIALTALGYHARLRARQVHKRWCDTRLNEWLWPSTIPSAQDKFSIDYQNRLMFIPKDGVSISNAEYAALRYTMPTGETISRISFNYDMQESAGVRDWRLGLYDVDGAAYLWSVTASGSGSQNITPGTPRQYLEFRFDNNSGGAQVGLGDGSEYGKITDLKVFSETGNIYAEEIIQDLLAMVSEISADHSQIGSPSLTLEPFVTGGWKPLADVVAQATGFGDASQNTWGFCVWDSEKSSDGLPWGVLEQRDTSDYEYLLLLSDKVVQEFHSDPSLDQVYNWIVAEFKDAEGRTAWVTPDDDANLKDQDSIDEYDQCDYVLKVDTESSTTATNLARRFLARHKDPVYKTRIVVKDQIPDKRRVLQPACRVRAGERVKIQDYLDGTTYFIAYTSYNAATGILELSPDLPVDDVGIMLAQLQLGR